MCTEAISTILLEFMSTAFLQMGFLVGAGFLMQFCSNLCGFDFAIASLIHRCLSKTFVAPIGFAQRISQPSHSAMLLLPILLLFWFD